MGEKLAEYMSKMNKNSCLSIKLPNLPDLFPNSQQKKEKKQNNPRTVQKTQQFSHPHTKTKAKLQLRALV